MHTRASVGVLEHTNPYTHRHECIPVSKHVDSRKPGMPLLRGAACYVLSPFPEVPVFLPKSAP